MTEPRDRRHRAAARPPSTIRLVLLVLEGYAYLLVVVGIFVAAVAFLLWGLLNQRPFIALAAIFVGVPLVVTTLRAIRSLFFASSHVEGVVLTPELGGALLRAVDDIRRRLGAPRVDRVVISDRHNASVLQVPRAGVFWPRNTLILGYPLMATLSAEQLRAVIAHELAHITHTHGRLGSWVYRTKRSWLRLMTDLDARGAVPIYAHLLFRWYVPRLDAQSAAVSQEHEQLADRLAAEVAGAEVTAEALVAVERGGYLLDGEFWPRLFERVDEDAAVPRPFAEMTTYAWSGAVLGDEILNELLEPDTAAGDTHPSLKDRIARLQRTPRLPPPLTRSAASEFLGDDQEAIVAKIDQAWQARHSSAWRERHDVVRRDRERLAHLQETKSPTAQQLFEQAVLVESGGEEAKALVLYESAHAAGSAAAGLAVGRIRLDSEDDSGLTLIEAAMDADPSLVDEGCEVAIAFLERRGRTADAHRLEARRTRHATLTKIAADEREKLTVVDRLERCADERVDVERLRRRLATAPTVQRAFLVSKVLRHSAGTQTILALFTNRPSPDLEPMIHREGVLPEGARVVILGRHDQQLQAALEATGGLVYSI